MPWRLSITDMQARKGLPDECSVLLAGQEEAAAAEGGEFEAPEGPSEMKSESLSTAAAAAIAARAAAAARLREEEQKRRLLEEEAVGTPHLMPVPVEAL